MNKKFLLIFISLLTISTISRAQTKFSIYFSGFYAGFEAGIVNYNTQITFDGVNDPAGRGGELYGALLGYNQTYNRLFIALEMFYNFASDIDPYTFDPDVVGFSELNLQQGNRFGLDASVGYLLTKIIVLYGTIGCSTNKQSVFIDGKPLDQYSGGATAENYFSFQFGAGLEVAIHSWLVIRVSFKNIDGNDMKTTDFGTIPANAGLTHFELESSQHQFLIGLIFHFSG